MSKRTLCVAFLPHDGALERSIATSSRRSVRLSVTLRYRDLKGWNSSKTI